MFSPSILKNIKKKNHRYPTRKFLPPCEQYNQTTMHKDIRLEKNKSTGRKAALDGFLQHAYSVWDTKQQKMLEFNDLIKDPKTKQIWTTSLANELGRLSQGIRNIKGSNCIKFIYKEQVPKGRNVTYSRLVVDYIPGKSDPNRTRVTVGGNLLTYEGELYTETTDIQATKMLLNSVYQQEEQSL